MSKFTPLVEYETGFEGDTVTMKIRRMTRADQQNLIPFMGDVDDEGQLKMSFKDENELSNAMLGLLPQNIKEFAGLKDESGEDISLETAIKETYFMGLISEILMKLMEVSNIKAEDKKKSGESPGGSSRG